MKRGILLLLLLIIPFLLLANSADSLFQQQIDQADSLRRAGQKELALDNLLALRSFPQFNQISCEPKGNWYHRIGICYYVLRQNEQALSFFRDSSLSLRLKCLGRQNAETANSYYAVATIHRKNEEKIGAVQAMKNALLILESLEEKDSLNLAYKYLQAGSLYHDLGDYGLADAYLNQSLAYYQVLKGEDNKYVGELYNVFGHLKNDVKQYNMAVPFLKKAIAIFQNLGEEDYALYLSTSYHNIAIAYLHLKDFNNCENFLQKAIVINQKIKSQTELSKNLETFAVSKRNQKTYSAAIDLHRQALSIRRKLIQGGISQLIASSYENLAAVYTAQNQFDTALENYQIALRNLQPDFQPTSLIDNPIILNSMIYYKLDMIRVLGLKAETLRLRYATNSNTADLQIALQTYHKLDSLIEITRRQYRAAGSKYALIDASLPVYEAAIKTAIQLYTLQNDPNYLEQAYAFSAKNKVILLLEGLQELEARVAGVPDSLLQKEVRLKKQFYQLESQLYDFQAAGKDSLAAVFKSRLFDAQREYEKLVDQLEDSIPAYYELKYSYPAPSDLNRLRDSLPENAALIEYFVGEKQLFIFCLTRNGLRHYQSDLPANFRELCLQFRRLQEGESTFNRASYTPIAQPLYEQLLAAPLSDLPDGINRLIIIPDDVLLQFSFDILPYEDLSKSSGEKLPFLIKQYAYSVTYSSRLLYEQEQERLLRQSALFGGFGLEYDKPTLDGISKFYQLTDSSALKRAMGRLAFSDDEVREIADLFDGETWLNEKATKQAFLENAEDYRVLHFAMHAISFEDHPLSSALIFSRTNDTTDYLLRAGDIYNQRLNAEMAVLSACHTGSGALMRGEGVRSLARAFSYAGCPSLVASLWSASDFASRKIMVDFYGHLKNGVTKDEAMRLAKLEFLEKALPTYRNPALWSHLVVIGDTGVLALNPSSGNYWNWLLVGLGSLLMLGLLLRRAKRS